VPSLTSAAAWPVTPPLLALVAVALIYWYGGRRRVSASRRSLGPRLHAAAFYAGLLSIAIALDSPLEPAADLLFSAHMAQHVLLLSVAPALIVVAAPWPRLWWPLPLGQRRATAKAFVRPRSRSLETLVRLLGRPLVAWLVFTANMLIWHLPALYDATIRSVALHDLEHLLFFSSGLLFWTHAIDSRPLRARLGVVVRSAYLIGAMLVGWVLSLVLAFATSPLYPAYAGLAHRPGGLSALGDQQIAAGVMWVPGSLAYTVAVIALFYRGLAPEPSRRSIARLPIDAGGVTGP
jgi:cytochrome c oxidase assembly factor CtaG